MSLQIIKQYFASKLKTIDEKLVFNYKVINLKFYYCHLVGDKYIYSWHDMELKDKNITNLDDLLICILGCFNQTIDFEIIDLMLKLNSDNFITLNFYESNLKPVVPEIKLQHELLFALKIINIEYYLKFVYDINFDNTKLKISGCSLYYIENDKLVNDFFLCSLSSCDELGQLIQQRHPNNMDYTITTINIKTSNQFNMLLYQTCRINYFNFKGQLY